MGPLDHPYPDFHPSDLPDIFYFLLSSISHLHHLFHSTLLPFFSCIHTSLLPSSSGTGSCYILRMGFSFTISNFSPFAFNILCYISCFSIYRAIWLYIFQITLYWLFSSLLLSLVVLLLLLLLYHIPFWTLLLILLHSTGCILIVLGNSNFIALLEMIAFTL